MPHQEFVDADGKKWPSVTEFLDVINKRFLTYWYGKLGTAECERIKKQSTDIGSRVHDAVERGLRGEVAEPLVPEEASLVTTALRWVKEAGFKHKELELHVKHEKLGYHGTFDVAGEFSDNPGVLWVGDWKTSSRVSPEYALQLCAYAMAYNTERGLTWKTGINNGFICRLEKDVKKSKSIEIKTFNDLRTYEPYVKAALTLWKGGYGK